MSASQGTAMDVDSPAGTLKRCSSAPMINENNTGLTSSPTATTSSRDSAFNIFENPRRRRSMSSTSPYSIGSPKLTHRINQLKHEEFVDMNNSRELAHEREIHSTMQISQSWEDLRCTDLPKTANKMAPLHLSLPPYGSDYSNSPSPTRICRSPGIMSPSRQQMCRSPVLRPSTLCSGLTRMKRDVKRKIQDDDKLDYNTSSPPTKRINCFANNSSQVDRNCLLTTSSPLPGSLSSISTPESISSADSPSFQFRMLDSPSPNRPPVGDPLVTSTTSKDHEMTEGPS